jgi:hypothetical protein
VTVYSFISFLFHNSVTKRKSQNIHHKAGLSYEVVKAGPLCLTSSQSHNLNNMYRAIFFCRLTVVGQVDLTGG